MVHKYFWTCTTQLSWKKRFETKKADIRLKRKYIKDSKLKLGAKLRAADILIQICQSTGEFDAIKKSGLQNIIRRDIKNL